MEIGNKSSQMFQNNEGMRQGGVLSPLLFPSVMDEVIKETYTAMAKYTLKYS